MLPKKEDVENLVGYARMLLIHELLLSHAMCDAIVSLTKKIKMCVQQLDGIFSTVLFFFTRC